MPTITGRPLIWTSVGLLPLLLATVSVLPVADGRGACSGISMWRTLSLMVVFILVAWLLVLLTGFFGGLVVGERAGRDSRHKT